MLRPPHLFLQAALLLLTLIVGLRLGIYLDQAGIVRAGGNLLQSVQVKGSGQLLADPEHQADLSLFWTVWKLLNVNYVDPQKLQPQTMVQGATAGLVQALGDPYTLFMTPKENTDFQDTLSGRLQGIGAELSLKNGLVTVVAPLKGSPAEHAGLRTGDVLDKVDGTSIQGLTLSQVVEKVRGIKGTPVTLSILRPKQTAPLTLKIVRDDIHVPSVESKIIFSDKGPVGYVTLNQFGEGSIDEVRNAFLDLQKQGMKMAILDLRNNGGGYLDGAVDLVSLFVKQGTIVSVEHRSGAPEVHIATGHPLFPDIPLAVLQNEDSASASEITAGALQDLGRATIIGMKSFGKGTVQEVIALPDGSSLRVTVARWLTPKGKNLGKEGVHPDIEVQETADAAAQQKDSQLDAAVDWLAHHHKPAASSSSAAAGSGSTASQ